MNGGAWTDEGFRGSYDYHRVVWPAQVTEIGKATAGGDVGGGEENSEADSGSGEEQVMSEE